ncbi:MAG: hypothetical protein QXO15_06855 [Nitrososphaerota archaeon]
MRKLGYAEFVRLEVPISLQPTPQQEILNRCVKELKSAEDSLVRGDWKGAINTCRNIIMNYLTEPEDRSKLKGELSDFIINRFPTEGDKEIYRGILFALGKTLGSNLQHIHKFIKEDTAQLIRMPLKEDAEYVYLMLIAIVKYLSSLILTWS